MKRIFYSLFIILSLTSCAGYHSGIMIPSAALSSNNFEIKELVSVSSEVKYFLGFGGYNRDALILETKKKLYAKYPLKKGQVFGNISVDQKFQIGLIFTKNIITISADIIEFDGATSEIQPIYNKVRNNHLKKQEVNNNLVFNSGETVYYLDNNEVFIGEIKEVGNGLILIISSSGESNYLNPKDVYKRISKEADIYIHPTSSSKPVKFNQQGKSLNGKIVGHNWEYWVIETNSKLYLKKANEVTNE